MTDEIPYKIALDVLTTGAPGLAQVLKEAIARSIAMRLQAQPAGVGEIKPSHKAYALLWREMRVSDAPFVREARAELLRVMTHAEQRAAIAWAVDRYPVTRDEMERQ